MCILIKFLQNIPVSFSSVFTSPPKIPHTSVCLTQICFLSYAQTHLKISCQLIFHSPGSHITRQTALSIHCHLSALKVFIRLTAPTSFAIFISRHACRSCDVLRWKTFCLHLESLFLTPHMGVRGNLYKGKRTMKQDVKAASWSMSHSY